MKKVLWVIVLFLLLATFSDHPLIKPYKTQLFNMFSEKAENASQVHGEQSLRTLRNRFNEIAKDMGKGQQAELDRIAGDVQTLLEFHQQYCVEKQFNSLFFSEGLTKVCQAIDEQKQGLSR
jgi:hypothetical protein